MAAWHEPQVFDCELCEQKPTLKEQLGCNGPPIRNGRKTKWRFPQNTGKVKIDRCPVRYVTPDIWDLFRALNLAKQTISLSEQERLPTPYVEALNLAAIEQDNAHAERLRQRTRAKPKGGRHG